MRKLLTILMLMLLACSLTGALAQSEFDSSAGAEREALVSWVAQNAHYRLDRAKSAEIVDTATYYAAQRGLDVKLVLAVIRAESGFRATAVGKGSKGLMQVQVNWHRDKLRGRNPLNAKVSIEVGTQILSDCWSRTPDSPTRALSCYSGGGGKQYYAKVEHHRRTLEHYVHTTVFDRFIEHLADG